LANEKFNEQQKKTIAQNLVNEYLKQIFTQGFCQGDNNFSNVLINPITLEVYWIDFGNWIVIDSELRKSLFTLIYKTIYKQDLNYLGHFENIGFDLNKLVHFQNLIPNLLQVLFDPFLLNSPYNLHNWRMEERINQLLGENKWWFRSSGNSNFLELMKSFFGLIKVIEYLNIKLNWQELFLNNADSFKLSSLENGLNNYINTIPKNKELAKSLVIQIIKDNKEHVKVELPATTFFELENLISDDIKLKLQIRKIDIMKIKEDYLEKGLRAGQVFTLDDQNSTFKIFLI
jgi:predicted unusual protein kinase regulating ubiquinone biosynthesis (AarF/ABC1/UbiB family)